MASHQLVVHCEEGQPFILDFSVLIILLLAQFVLHPCIRLIITISKHLSFVSLPNIEAFVIIVPVPIVIINRNLVPLFCSVAIMTAYAILQVIAFYHFKCGVGVVLSYRRKLLRLLAEVGHIAGEVYIVGLSQGERLQQLHGARSQKTVTENQSDRLGPLLLLTS